MWLQKQLILPPYSRGFHLITDQIEAQLIELQAINVGLLHLLLQHTSASLSLNENADPSVRADLEAVSNRLVPEGAPDYLHTYEGSDDLPAHVKSALFGAQLTIPISNGKLNLGTWQGVILGEHRNRGGSRRIIATISGD